MKYGISVPKEEANEMFQLMKKLERDGAFKDFMDPYKPYPDTKLKYPDRQQLLDSINPNMRLTESFFRRIYCYEVTYPGFAEIALQKLEEAGSTKSRDYYKQFSEKYEDEHRKAMDAGYDQYLKEKEKQRQEEERKKVKEWRMKENLQRENDRQLLKRWQRLNRSIQA